MVPFAGWKARESENSAFLELHNLYGTSLSYD